MSHHHLFSLQRDSLGYFHLKAWPPITPVAATYGKSYWDPSDWEYFNLLSLDGMIFNDTFTPFPTIIKVLRDVLQLFLRIVFEDFCIRSCSIANRVHLNVIFKIPSRILAAHQNSLDPVLGYSVHLSLFVW